MRLNHTTVKREMQAQRWTTTALAEELEIDRATLSSYLTGRRRVPGAVLVGLQQALNVNPYTLLGPEDPEQAIVDLVEAFAVDPERFQSFDVPRHGAETAA